MAVRFEGLEAPVATASGHHFRDPGSGLWVRYGAATWVDAKGRREVIPARWVPGVEGGALVLVVARELLERSTFPAVLDPYLSAELEPEEPVIGPSTDYLSGVALASDGRDYLATWRKSAGGSLHYAARVSADGTVLDREPMLLTPELLNPTPPVVAFGGGSYLIIHGYSPVTSGPTAGPAGVRAHRVSAAEGVQETFDLSDDGSVAGVAAAPFGEGFAVAWARHKPRTLEVVALSGEGTVEPLGSAPLPGECWLPPSLSCTAGR